MPRKRRSRDIKHKARKPIRIKRRSYNTVDMLAIAAIGTSLAYLGKKVYHSYNIPSLQTNISQRNYSIPSLQTNISQSNYSNPSLQNNISEKFKLNYDNTYIEVMPDVEGCWSKVVDFMSLSNIFTIDGKPPNAGNLRPENFNDPNYNALKMARGTKFVCLGDTIDNGPNNIAILKLLKYLKEKFCTILGGCTVIFILGNRDINKLRFLYELDRKNTRIDIETNQIDERLLPTLADKVPPEYSSWGSGKERVKRFQWIAENTMGAKNILKFIKEELNLIDDKQAVEEYMKLIAEDGLIGYYLKNGHLLHYDNNTKSLFVHGAINCSNFRKHYSKIYDDNDKSGNIFTNMVKWEKFTNMILKDVLSNIYMSQKEREKRYLEEPDSMLDEELNVEYFFRYMDEQVPKKAAKSVIISRPWKSLESASPSELETGIGTSIIKEGCFDEIAKEVKYIFNGHTPVGQIPVIMREQNINKEIVFVFCDTTYAGRIGNIKLVKDGLGIHNYQVAIKAKYTKEQKKIFTLCGQDPADPKYTFTEFEYSTKDPFVGTGTVGNSYVIAQIRDTEYLIGKWKLEKMSKKYPDTYNALSVKYDTTNIMD